MSDARTSLPPLGAALGDRYELIERIAEGAMGAVYRAEDRVTFDEVAAKVLRPELLAEADIRRRFRRESAILKAIDHAAVVRILDFGSDAEGHSYTIMELLDGPTLGARIERGKGIEAGAMWPLLSGICGGLGALHEHGVIHGDLKPENLLVVDEARFGSPIKIIDFGLSKVIGLERLTRTGEMAGTPAYMAPEVVTGKPALSPRLDIYAAGVILYHALSGFLPYEGKHPGKLLMDIATGKRTPLCALAPWVPKEIGAVVAKAMAVEPEDRYESAAELAEAYRAALMAAGVEAL